MTYVVSITSQGQISIPAPLRRQFNLNTAGKANVFVQDQRIVVEPIPDIMSLAGVFKTRKKTPFKKIHEDFGNYMATRHLRKNDLSI